MAQRKPIPKAIRQMLYEKYNHRCAYCGSEIEYKDMQVDHIHPVMLSANMTDDELNRIENYLPACRQCNFYKSTLTVEMFRWTLSNTLLPNIQKTFQFRLAKKYGLVEDKISPIRFYFEQLIEMEATSD